MRRLANYLVEDEPLARGGMGQIFKGQDDRGNTVAIKEILPEFANDLAIISRIEKEVEFLVKIDHPSIVKLYSAFRDPMTQSYYIVMEMVDGVNLEQYVIRNGAISWDKATDLMIRILDAMQCVHHAHIVHRDIKPSNIMLRNDGTVCLLDFGVAKDLDSKYNTTVAGSIIGTNGYMSPEQAEGYSISYRSDIYSLGCVFYYMLTGHHAFNTLGSEFETADAIITKAFPKLSKYKKGLPDFLQKVLDKATAKNMMQRYNSCQDFIAALSGTIISDRGRVSSPTMITVGRERCDILINDRGQKISRHHADIELKEFTGGTYYLFTDVSSNGTMVNGKMIKKSSVSIPTSGPAPEIYLAGVADGRLDWNEVVTRLRRLHESNNAPDSGDTQVNGDPITGELDVIQEPDGDNNSDLNEVVVPWQLDPGFEQEEEKENEGDSAVGPLIAGTIFALLGGLLGIALGIHVLTAKKRDKNGTKVTKYKESHRKLAWGVIMLAIGSYFIWTMALR